MAFCVSGSSDPPFTLDELRPFRNILEDFLRKNNQDVDWSIRDHQPMHLKILQAFSNIMGDRDRTLFPSLLEGVSTGNDIPPSGICPPNEDNQVDHTPLSIHSSNWTSAEENLDLTRTLVQEEVDKGWVYEFPGTLADAQQHFSCGIAIGKLGIATADQRPPRLVVGNSVCGLNSRCSNVLL